MEDLSKEIEGFIKGMDSPNKVYELFRRLGFPEVFDPSYRQKRLPPDLSLRREYYDQVEELYPLISWEGIEAFLIVVKREGREPVPRSLIRELARSFRDRYDRVLLILTADFREYVFVFPELKKEGEGRKLELVKLYLNRDDPYHTDLRTISSLAYSPEDKAGDVWRKWREAFSVRRVTREFFEGYRDVFDRLKKELLKHKVEIKEAHEGAHLILNRIMFLYFIAKKGWLGGRSRFVSWFFRRYLEEKSRGSVSPDSFYEDWLKLLFLDAFNNIYGRINQKLPPDIRGVLTTAPNLNGGLFKKTEFDDLILSLPDELFRDIINGFFDRYNFTIREELPLEVEVAVDPQMLGYVYESLANVAEETRERHDKGIFYTPREEVDFMCRRALTEYFAHRLPDVPKERFFYLLFGDEEEKKKAISSFKEENLVDKLEELTRRIKVVDPACGSGAFLVGMLLILSELYRDLGIKLKDYDIKKRIIRDNLYGVDVMPWAVRMAEIRLWLQLVIETKLPLPELKRRPLLPNLDLKLRVGDSLIQEIGGISFSQLMRRLSPSLKREIRELEEEKRLYFSSDSSRYETPEDFRQAEVKLIKDIIWERKVALEKEITNKTKELNELSSQGEFLAVRKDKRRELDLVRAELDRLKEEERKLEELQRKLPDPEKKPFIWEIDFAEVFAENGGFDIVIGNPPYVRQEQIAPPRRNPDEVSRKEKDAYKESLINSVKEVFPYAPKIDKKSDYYIYFYFHGLSLLNKEGVFCFITSNSWLDVDYGKSLQEFLAKYVPIKAIYDNEAERSFEHADVNTVISLFGAPLPPEKGEKWTSLGNTARFVMFKKPFSEVVNAKTLIEIEEAEDILNSDSFRVFPVKQEILLAEGWEHPEEEEVLDEPFSRGRYIGGKWGGMYLRAPEIFFTILKKGRGKLVPLGEVAEVRFGIKTGANEFFYVEDITEKAGEEELLRAANRRDIGSLKEAKEKGLRLIRPSGKVDVLFLVEEEYIKPVIKSPRELHYLVVREEDLRYRVIMCHKKERELRGSFIWDYIRFGEKRGYHKRPTCRSRHPWWDLGERESSCIIWPSTYRERFFVADPRNSWRDKRFYDIYPENKSYLFPLMFVLNSMLIPLFSEVYSISYGGGGGPADTRVYEVKKIKILHPLSFPFDKKSVRLLTSRPIRSIFEELGFDKNKPIREQKPNPLPDRKALDDIVFDALGLTEEERNEVYYAVAELVQKRLKKAKTV
ncbi:MAG: Eco57I restriction-modification methylase domain-containing protein [Acidobacteria bacterium]|nr:Eco57I restriction-modification methylase domain-containing protein [Acidobacteriota bacterium]